MADDLQELNVEHGPAVANEDLPVVAVVIVNCDGRQMLGTCLESLDASDYPADKIQVVVVDNGSSDGSVPWLQRAWPDAVIVANDRNLGFTPACNQGAKAAGDVPLLAFLNNDVRVDRAWLRELVSPIVRGECASTGAQMLNPDGTKLDHAGGGTNFHGIAVAHGYQDPPGADYDTPRRVLFACGGAMAITREVFEELDGFDEDFFAYYDDLDIGWRTNLLGHEVHYVPRATCRHDHSGTSRRFPPEQIRLLQVRNSLLCCLKAYDDDHLDRLLPSLLALAMRRMYVFARIDDDAEFRIEKAGKRETGKLANWWRKLTKKQRTWSIDRIAAGDFHGINDVLGRWDHWMQRRAEVQRTRKVDDETLFRLFLNPLWCIEGEQAYEQLQKGLLERSGMLDVLSRHEYGLGDPFK